MVIFIKFIYEIIYWKHLLSKIKIDLEYGIFFSCLIALITIETKTIKR